MLKNNYAGRKNSFISKKTGKTFELRSMLERKYADFLEHDNKVLTYDYERISISYSDSTGKIRSYTPDFLVIYLNKTVKIIEVKPKKFVDTDEVQYKKTGAEAFLKSVYKNFNISYEIVTEEDISNSYESVIHRLIAEKEKTGVNIPNAKKKRRRSKVSLSGHRNNRVVRAKR